MEREQQRRSSKKRNHGSVGGDSGAGSTSSQFHSPGKKLTEEEEGQIRSAVKVSSFESKDIAKTWKHLTVPCAELEDDA